MLSISSITRLPIGNGDAIVEFENGYQMLVRILDEHEGRSIIYTPNHKLVAITKVDDKFVCETLIEGISIH